MGKMDNLGRLENQSIFIIREAYAQFRNVAMLWSIGKDSTTLLWLVRKAFFGKVPFPVMHIDTGYKFRQIYEFRDKIVRKWHLNLKILRNESALKQGISAQKGRFDCCNLLKTAALRQGVSAFGLEALLLAIRRDEHTIRSKERYFSPRDKDFRWNYQQQPAEMWGQFYLTQGKDQRHTRIHPMLHWQEIDIWKYIKRENLPVVKLYFSRRGLRYRSIGCQCCCQPVNSGARTLRSIIKELSVSSTAERAGRVQDKEKAYMMQKLRALGYM